MYPLVFPEVWLSTEALITSVTLVRLDATMRDDVTLQFVLTIEFFVTAWKQWRTDNVRGKEILITFQFTIKSYF